MSQKHWYFIDILRVAASLAIVTIHVVSSVATYSPVPLEESRIEVLELIHRLMNWAVPVFFMITGFVFLNSETPYTWQRMRGKLLRLVGLLFVFGIPFSLLEQLYVSRSFSAAMLGQALLDVVNGNLWAHMWFLYALFPIYLLIPLLWPAFHTDYSGVCRFTVLLGAFTIVLPLLQSQLPWIHTSFAAPLNAYAFYTLFGAAAGKNILQMNGRKKKLAAGLSVAAFCLGAADVLLWPSLAEYTGAGCALMAMAMFCGIAVLLKEKAIPEFLVGISSCSLGVYIIHPVFLNIQCKVLRLSPVQGRISWVLIPVNILLIYLISFSVVWLGKRMLRRK